MKNLVKTVLGPLSRRVGSVAAGAIAASLTIDPTLAIKLEAWVAAGVLLAVDLIMSNQHSKSQEVR